MSSGQSLALYRELIPALSMPGKRRKYNETDIAYTLTTDPRQIAVFDCRALPTAFVDDTGDAAYEELRQTKEEIHLPFAQCYFEFADEPRMVYAGEVLSFGGSELTEEMIATMTYDDYPKEGYLGYEIEVYDLSINATYNGVWASFLFGEPPPGIGYEFYSISNQRPRERVEHWDIIGKRVLAVAVLMNEQLVIDKVKPDPAPKVSRERERLQKPPVSGETHVLTINVPIVRYRASRNTPQGDTHESPALHWRRGHWRVYHRGSNFEQTGWVQRCLVGDPAKGYQRNTQYRLVHRPTPFRVIEGGMHEQGTSRSA